MAINIVLTMAEASASSSAHMQLTMKFNSDLIWFKCAALLRFVGTMGAKSDSCACAMVSVIATRRTLQVVICKYLAKGRFEVQKSMKYVIKYTD